MMSNASWTPQCLSITPVLAIKEHHGFWVSFKTFTWLWHFVKHFADLLVYMCLLAGWPLDFGLRVLLMILYVFATINKEIQSWNIPQPYARSIR
jgi:hypothetical protein